MWVAAERPPRTRAARLFVFSRTCVIISKPVTPCKTFRGNMAEFFNRLLEKLDTGVYAAAADPVGAFAADVELLNDAWPAEYAKPLVSSLDLGFPADYRLAENWERFRRAFYFLDNLNGGPTVVTAFAAAGMGPNEAQRLKELLRSKFGEETWLTLSA